jgi:hypothetical protein
MKAPRQLRYLQLESLESRTLLAADLAADFDLASKALTGTGPFDASFSINFGNSQLVLSGHGTEALSVDLDRLPAFITNLKISSFSAVTFTGTDHVDTLIVSDVGKFSAPDLSVTRSLHVSNVASVDLASAGVIAVLNGTSTSLSVRSLDSTMIITDLSRSLTVNSESKSLYVVGLNSEQSLNLKYRPETVSIAGLTQASVHMVDDLVLPPPVESSSGSTHTDPGTGTGTGTTTPAPIEKPVNIITLPLDERTRQFLAELRDVVRAAGKDPEHLVSEFVAHGLTPAVNVTPAPKPIGTPTDALRAEFAAIARLTGEIVASSTSGGNFRTEAAGTTGSDRRVPELGNAEIFSRILSAPTPGKIEILNVDATWPVALPIHPANETNAPLLPVVKDSERDELKIADSVRAFGSYIVDRFTAEFSPGEQSLILLVDPKPAPAGSSNPASAIEAFARGTRKIVANLRSVHG